MRLDVVPVEQVPGQCVVARRGQQQQQHLVLPVHFGEPVLPFVQGRDGFDQLLAGIGRALADLPGQAQRYVRWKARSDARRVGRVIVPRSPLRPGRAPGWRVRSKNEINEVLADMQYFAREVLRAPDTS